MAPTLTFAAVRIHFSLLLYFSTLTVVGVDSSKTSENFRGRRPAAC
jgi:hypothetical protein